MLGGNEYFQIESIHNYLMIVYVQLGLYTSKLTYNINENKYEYRVCYYLHCLFAISGIQCINMFDVISDKVKLCFYGLKKRSFNLVYLFEPSSAVIKHLLLGLS